MIKQLFIGIWVCAISLGSAYGVMVFQGQSGSGDSQAAEPQIEQVQTKMLNVPVVDNGSVKGYIMAQFVFQINADMMKELAVKPDIFLVDEALKVLYTADAVDFRKTQKRDVPAVAQTIMTNLNKRFGENFVREVLVQELSYMSRDGLRGQAR